MMKNYKYVKYFAPGCDFKYPGSLHMAIFNTQKTNLEDKLYMRREVCSTVLYSGPT